MDSASLISSCRAFIEENYKSQLLEHNGKGNNRLVIDFYKLSSYSVDLSEEFFDDPNKFFTAMGLACCEVLQDVKKNFNTRFFNLPKNTFIDISCIRSKNINTFITVKGVIRSRTSVTPSITSISFECPSCGNVISVLQTESKIVEPNKCGCGRKGKFKMLSKELIDGLSMRVEESPEFIDSNRLESIHIIAREDLTDEKIEPKLVQGRAVEVSGVLKTVFKTARDGSLKTELSWYLDANYIRFIEQSEINLKITTADLIDFERYKCDPNFLSRASECLFYKIEGLSDIKKLLLITAFGGVTEYNETGVVERRGDIHLLVVGEAGTGKSFLLQLFKRLIPKSYMVFGGRSTSVAGLLYAATKDELINQWTIEAGAFPLANKGVVVIDEMDKFEMKELDQLHGPMEQQLISVNKANIRTTLKCECGVVAASNPKLGRFSNFDVDIVNQLGLSLTLINRFDMIFLLRDVVDEERDKRVALKILSFGEGECDNYISETLFKKYVLYAKKINPKIPKELNADITQEFARIRQLGKGKSFPISERQMVTILRLAQSHARSRLSHFVELQDVNFAFSCMITFLKQFVGEADGVIDVDVLTIGSSHSFRNVMDLVLSTIINYKSREHGLCSFVDIEEACKAKGIPDLEIEKAIAHLQKVGFIFEPRVGYYDKL